MSFIAEYYGECEACGGQVKGQECTFTTDFRIMHVKCPQDELEAPREIPLCQKCWTYHRGECL